jgi:hypothetical protein
MHFISKIELKSSYLDGIETLFQENLEIFRKSFTKTIKFAKSKYENS